MSRKLRAAVSGVTLMLLVPLCLLAAPEDKTVGLIDSPSVNCYQPDAALDQCFVKIQRITVSASPDSLTELKFYVEGNLRARVGGFFQESMDLNHEFFGPYGFRVACGESGASGDPDPDIGFVYSWELVARDSQDFETSNNGSVKCPAYVP